MLFLFFYVVVGLMVAVFMLVERTATGVSISDCLTGGAFWLFGLAIFLGSEIPRQMRGKTDGTIPPQVT